VRRGDLPTSQRSLNVVAATSRDLRPLDRLAFLETAPQGRVTIPGGSVITFELDLKRWFPAIDETLSGDDVLVFCRYRAHIDGRANDIEIFGGTVLRR
jgi:hypothetical protein